MVTERYTATEQLTTTEAAVLALLAIEGERSGYELLKHVERAIAYVWAPARSQLYALLPRLVSSGWARSRTVRQSARPDKTLYRIGPAGRKVLDAWFRTYEPRDRDAFSLRLFVGGLTTPDVLLEHVARQREDTEAQLDELRAIEPTNTRTGHDFHHYFLLRLGIDEAEQRLRWLAWVERELRKAYAA